MITFVLCWLFAAVLVGLSGLLRNTALTMPALSTVIVVALLSFLAISREARARAVSSIRTLVAVHLIRFFGIYFLWLARQGLLAQDFAMLAGWGPIIIAIGALVILVILRADEEKGRMAIVVWNVVGILDVLLMTAVMARLAEPDPLVKGGFATLPLSLVPTFIIPLVIVSHLLIFVWWHRRNTEETQRTSGTLDQEN